MTACAGFGGEFEIDAAPRGNESFEPGTVEACALARVGSHGETDDAHQWCRDVTLTTGE